MKDKKEDLSFKELRELDNANSKDIKMNTPKKLDDGISIMPHDQETLKTFSIKEMNFKDMTNAQKNTVIIIITLIVLLLIVILTPSIRKMFGGVTIGNLRFKPLEQEEVEEKKSYVYAGDLIVIGNNTSVLVENIRFNNFTKGSNYSGLFNYIAQEDIDDVSSLKIYVEYYNYSKVLLRRFKFNVEGNSLKKDEKGTIENVLSENAFNKAHYVTIRVMSDVEIIEVPDPEENAAGDGSEDNPTDISGKENQKSNPNELTCKRVSVDTDLRINEVFFVEFENNMVKQYTVDYKITSVSYNSKAKKYAKYYKKMLKRFEELDKTYISQISILEDLNAATLRYVVPIVEYIGIELDEKTLKKDGRPLKEIYEEVFYKDKKYKLEIEIFANKAEVKKELEKDGFICEK